MDVANVIERRITVRIVQHKVTHLLVAMSDDLPGLMIAARSDEQIDRELPTAIRELLEANGEIVLSVDAEAAGNMSSDFHRNTIIANARLEMAHG